MHCSICGPVVDPCPGTLVDELCPVLVNPWRSHPTLEHHSESMAESCLAMLINLGGATHVYSGSMAGPYSVALKNSWRSHAREYSGRWWSLPSIIARIRGGAMSAAFVTPWRSHASIIVEPCSIRGPVRSHTTIMRSGTIPCSARGPVAEL
jgi:hypothetical protein